MAADALISQLGAAEAPVRDNAAKSLEAMGPKAAKALAAYIVSKIPKWSEVSVEGKVTIANELTKAASILGNIGKGVAEDGEVRSALLSAAEPGIKHEVERTKWPTLEMRVAAIEALGKINEHRGDIGGKPLDPIKIIQARVASCELEAIAHDLFDGLAKDRKAQVVTTNDSRFYANFTILVESEADIIEFAGKPKPPTLQNSTFGCKLLVAKRSRSR